MSRTIGAIQAYDLLMRAYGPQGWWPLLSLRSLASAGEFTGYHPGDYTFPRDGSERFEIAAGAVLTQNTSWKQAECALEALHREGWLSPGAVWSAAPDRLKELIRPSGYYNQKGERLRLLARFFLDVSDPSREELLALKGVGPETADSILLYAFGKPEFVIDAYTRRIWGSLGHLHGAEHYDEVKQLFVDELPSDPQLYQEFHALIVEHAKRCSAHPTPAQQKRNRRESGAECILEPIRRRTQL